MAVQPPTNSQPPPPYPPPPNNSQQFGQPPPYYSPPLYGVKVMGEKTKWALGLGIATLLGCGVLTGIFGFVLAKKDMDEIRAGRAPQLDEKWAQWAYYLNIVALILWVFGACVYFQRFGGMYGY